MKMNPKTFDYSKNGSGRVRVALCQIATRQWDMEGNFNRTMLSLEAAANQGAHLAITPECVFHGYAMPNADTSPSLLDEAFEPLDGPRITKICQLAKEKHMAVVLGFAEKGEGGRVYNSAALISDSGEMASVYRKVHCRSFESALHGNLFTPGDDFSVHEIITTNAAFRLGTMICFDREIPETLRCLRALGAHFVACPLACDTLPLNSPPDYAHNEMITQCRAAENELFIAVVNHANRFNGGSFVVGPGGEAIHQMGPEAGVDIVELPLGIVAEEFHSKPFSWMGWGYRNGDVYQKYLG